VLCPPFFLFFVDLNLVALFLRSMQREDRESSEKVNRWVMDDTNSVWGWEGYYESDGLL